MLPLMLKVRSIIAILRWMGTVFALRRRLRRRACGRAMAWAVSSGRAVGGGRCAQRAHVSRREQRAARWAVRGALPRARVGGRRPRASFELTML